MYFASLNAIFRIDPSGVFTHVAGTGRSGNSGDGGPATRAEFMNPAALAVDRSGNLYIADASSGRIRRVSRDGVITTVAGG